MDAFVIIEDDGILERPLSKDEKKARLELQKEFSSGDGGE